jgi:hypothetical protein
MNIARMPSAGRSGTAAAGPAPAGMAAHGWCAEWAAAWNSFWFTPADPLPLAVIRIITGVILTWACGVWLLDIDAFFGDRGWLRPDQVWRMNDQPWQWSLYFVASSPTMARVVAGISLVAAVLLTIGLATPLAAIVSFLGFVSAANRAPLNVFGLDDTLGMLLVPLVIGPAGARLSVDSLLLAPGRGRGGEPSVRAAIALRLLQVHLCVVYLFSGTGKLFGASWWEGTALWGAVANDRYRTLDLRGLAGHPLVVNGLTLATLWWEVTYAALVWPRLTRPLCLAMAVLVHLGIGLAMGMMEFGLAMITANLAFVPAATFEHLLRSFTVESPASPTLPGTSSDHP